MKNIIQLSIVLFLSGSFLIAQDKNITKDGVKLSLKTSSALGKDGKICTYCQDIKLSKNCKQLIVSKSGHKAWIPANEGPLYIVLKTGKTNNYNGLTLLKSKDGKFQCYYGYYNNQISFLTPVGKLAYLITIFNPSSKNLSSLQITKTVQEEAEDILNCINNLCNTNWSNCVQAIPHNLSSTEYWNRFTACTKDAESCEEICKNVEMEHVNKILIFRQTSGASSFNFEILK